MELPMLLHGVLKKLSAFFKKKLTFFFSLDTMILAYVPSEDEGAEN